MKIKNIKINAYGNLHNKDIELSDGINIIYGKNESGKSTLLKFITNMFYGTSKNKKGKDYSDYEKYKPWNTEEFSGKIKYKLDDENEYEIYREFGKKNPKIYNENSEEISKQFNIDKNNGNQFFTEQSKVDENTFMSTFVSMQQEVKLDMQSQNVLIQKIANLAGTGDDNISYKKALEKLSKRQLEEIGTSRSQGKPINIINNKINLLKNEKEDLDRYKEYKYEIEQNKNGIEESIEEKQTLNEILKKIKKINDFESNKFENIELNKKAIIKNLEQDKEYFNQIFDLKKEIICDEAEEYKEYSLEEFKKYGSKIFENNNDENKEKIKIKRKDINKKVNIFIYFFMFLVSISGVWVSAEYIKSMVLTVICLILIPTTIAAYFLHREIVKEKLKKQIMQKQKDEKKEIYFQNSKIYGKIDAIKQQMDACKNSNMQLELEIENISNEIKNEIKNQENSIIIEYTNKINTQKITELFNQFLENKNMQIQDVIAKKSELSAHNQSKLMYFISLPMNSEYGEKNSKLNLEIEKLTNEINNATLDLHRLDLNKGNIMPKVDTLSNIEEQLIKCEEEYNELIKKNDSINLAKQLLEKAYEKMKNSVTPKFTANLSKNIRDISNGKYNKVSVNDENGLIIELPNGEYISANRLSLGTIDQLYLSLRLSMINELTEETLPIILDESFAYYDDERLKNVLEFISENYKNRQIIIFTCTSREEKILENTKIKYNKITL